MMDSLVGYDLLALVAGQALRCHWMSGRVACSSTAACSIRPIWNQVQSILAAHSGSFFGGYLRFVLSHLLFFISILSSCLGISSTLAFFHKPATMSTIIRSPQSAVVTMFDLAGE
jgi:hypothetical protein